MDNTFVIRKAKARDLTRVMEIYAGAQKFMAQHGNSEQWGFVYPSRELIEKDIENGNSYVCMYGSEIAAVFYFRIGEDPTYAVIKDGAWKNNRPYGVVHRIASAGIVHGAATYCIKYAFSQCRNIRIDTHSDNYVMQNLLKKEGFEYCGKIYVADETERIAYQAERADTTALQLN